MYFIVKILLKNIFLFHLNTENEGDHIPYGHTLNKIRFYDLFDKD